MKTLTILDLGRSEQLDRPTMAAVRGGWKMGLPMPMPGDLKIGGRYDSAIDATQNLHQVQQVLLGTANGSAFVDGVHVDSHVNQDGNNKIVRRPDFA
jgi:hypothetical protein